MRSFALAAIFAAVLAPAAQAQEVHVFTPGVVFNSGIKDLAKSYTKETGVKVTVTSKGMAALINDAKTGTPVADIIVAPVSFMDGLEAEGAVVPGTVADIGRVYIGLAVPRGKPHPDMFLAAAEELGVTPVEAVVVEDAVAGVAAAKAGGMAVLGVARADDADLLAAASADLVVTTLDDVDTTVLADGRLSPMRR